MQTTTDQSKSKATHLSAQLPAKHVLTVPSGVIFRTLELCSCAGAVRKAGTSGPGERDYGAAQRDLAHTVIFVCDVKLMLIYSS